ncbi:MAG: hypothetical protein COV70_00910 [Parcubacteria group bacterium CG11_big_fil_rev_8_21_14_0_20_39_22]|nr:MAG: hypothetical protein COV70_00910 [Parcubacteria group bacterium CG11_big_fil_rev_8_21_14_0_20_39_22]
MPLLTIAITFSIIGHIVIALVVFSVHSHVLKERKIDDDVLTSMKRERIYVIVGTVFILTGYILEVQALNGIL